MKQKEIMHYTSVALIIAGVTLYVLTPMDLIPAKAGIVGFLDDGIVVLLGYLLFRRIRKKYKKR